MLSVISVTKLEYKNFFQALNIQIKKREKFQNTVFYVKNVLPIKALMFNFCVVTSHMQKKITTRLMKNIIMVKITHVTTVIFQIRIRGDMNNK